MIITRSLFYDNSTESLLLFPNAAFISDFLIQTFQFPTDSPFYSWHFPAFLCGSATSRTSLSPVQPRPPAHCCFPFGSDLFSLFPNPLSTWMSPTLISQQAICKFHILAFFPDADQSQIFEERPGGGSWVVCGWLQCSLALLRASPVSTRAAVGSYPKPPQPSLTPVGKSTEGYHFHALGYASSLLQQRPRGQRHHNDRH